MCSRHTLAMWSWMAWPKWWQFLAWVLLSWMWECFAICFHYSTRQFLSACYIGRIFSMSVPKLQLLATLAYYPKETRPRWMSNPGLQRMVSGVQLVIEQRPHPHSTRQNPWQFRCVYFNPNASSNMYVVMDDHIFGTYGTGTHPYRPHPLVYMNWFQELHDPSFPIESQWFDNAKIKSVICPLDQESGAAMAMANYMMPYRRGRGIPWSDWSAGLCW